MRLIDAEYLLDLIKDIDSERFGYIDAEDINNAPTVDAVPVVHGHWIVIENKENRDDYYKMECSVCGNNIWSVASEEWYCCKCGAKMDEVVE